MAKTFTAPFAQTPRTLAAPVTVALGGLTTDTVTGAVLIATAGADGALVTKLTASPRATVAATSLHLFLVKQATPTIYRPIDSELMTGYTASTSTATPETTFANLTVDNPMRLEAGDKLYVGSEIALAAGIVFYCEWMDF